MKTITRVDAIAFVNELHGSYKEQFENYDNDYALNEAKDILRGRDEFCADDVNGYLNPYLDALCESLK